jgi:hypothetical protein
MEDKYKGFGRAQKISNLPVEKLGITKLSQPDTLPGRGKNFH